MDFSMHTYGDVHSNLLSVITLISTVGFIISTVHAVLTICFIGELTGNVEPASFSNRLGLLNLMSLAYFMIGIIGLTLALCYHLCLFTKHTWAPITAFAGRSAKIGSGTFANPSRICEYPTNPM
jgi:hypothetical protein